MVKRFLIGFVAVLFLSIDGWGCAGGAAISSDVEVIEETEDAQQEPVAAPPMPADEPVPCHVTIDAKPSQEAIIRQEAEPWRRAAGCTVSFAPDGIPFTVSDEMLESPEEPGKLVYGIARVTTRGGRFVRCESLAVSNASDNPLRTLRHELGHCFGILGHTEDGLMKESHYPWEAFPINDEALTMLCDQVACPVFVPEN
jgi:hypothetical protein